MFPSFTSLSQRERKRQSLLKQAERDLQNDEIKRDAYSQAMWASDVEKNKINLAKGTTTTGVQTDPTSSTSTSTATPQSSSSSTGVFSTQTDMSPDPVGIRRNLMHEFDDVEYDEDIGAEDDSMSDIDDNDSRIARDDNDASARDAVRDLYREYPGLAILKLPPINMESGKPSEFAFLGVDSVMHSVSNGERSRIPEDRMDWVATLAYITNKTGIVRIRDNIRKRTKDVVFQSLFNESQDNKALEQEALDRISGFYRDLPNKMRSLDDAVGIYPVDKAGKIHTDLALRYDSTNNKLKVVDRERTSEQVSFYNKRVSWINTLNYILTRAEDIGADLNRSESTKRGAYRSPQTTPSDQRRLAKIQRGEDSLSIRDKSINDRQSYQRLEYILIRSPYLENSKNRVRPILEDGKIERELYFGSIPDIDDDDQPTPGGLEIYHERSNIALKDNHKTWKKVDWKKSFDEAVLTLKNIRHRTREGAIVSQINQTLIDVGVSAPDGSDDKDFIYTGRSSSRINLQGRGLMGGAITCKNLKLIEGTGTASDLKYKRLGSKFIRVADLRSNRLKLVYPNRTPVGKLRDIDPKLAQLINTLLFDKDIDQRVYGELSIDDKQLFCEILKATHLQHQFSNTLDDPIETLKAEFDKLKGQVMLGNDNPDLIRELKTISVDLYSQKLISEQDFKSIVLI